MALMSALNPARQLAMMGAEANPDSVAMQHPMHAMIAPISAAPPEISPDIVNAMNPMAPRVMGGSSAKVEDASPTDRYEQQQGKRLMGDIEKDENPYGSANNHPGFMGKLLHGLSVATGGPNRRAFEESGINNNLEAMQDESSKRNYEGAQTGKTLEETREMPGKTESEEGLQGAETRNLDSEVNQRENPSLQIHDTEQGPLLVNPKTGEAQHLTLDGQPVGPKVKLSYQTVDGPDGKPHTWGVDEQGNKVVDLGEHYERPISVSAGEKNLWSVPQPDGSKKVVELHPGDTIPTGAVSLSGQSQQNSKEGTADAPTVSALKFANDYLASGAFTGPSDEALQDQFFQMAKPSSGFRMNQAQIDQLHHMASWMDSWRGRAYHAINGTWFAPEQRAQIVKTMNDLAASKGIPTAQGSGGAQPQRPQGVPENAQYITDPKTGKKGWAW